MFDCWRRRDEWDAPVVGCRSDRPFPGHSSTCRRRRAGGNRRRDLRCEKRVARREAARGRRPSRRRARSTLAVGGRLPGDARASGQTCTWPCGAHTVPARLDGPRDRPESPSAGRPTLLACPAVVTGSNTYVAWDFTNTYATGLILPCWTWTPRTPIAPTLDDGNSSTSSTRWCTWPAARVTSRPLVRLVPLIGAITKGACARRDGWPRGRSLRVEHGRTAGSYSRRNVERRQRRGLAVSEPVVAERSGDRVTIFGAIPDRVGWNLLFPSRGRWVAGYKRLARSRRLPGSSSRRFYRSGPRTPAVMAMLPG